MDERFRKNERIQEKEDIRRVLRQRRLEGTYFYLYLQPNQGAVSRMAVLVSRAVGKAVVRNRFKRRLREIFRRTKGKLKQNVDVVIRAKKTSGEATYQDLASEYVKLVQQVQMMDVRNGLTRG